MVSIGKGNVRDKELFSKNKSSDYFILISPIIFAAAKVYFDGNR